MAEEKREGPQDDGIREILGELDAVLSDLGGGKGPAAPPLLAAPPPQPVAPPPAGAAPAAPPAAAAPGGMSIELGPRPLSAKAVPKTAQTGAVPHAPPLPTASGEQPAPAATAKEPSSLEGRRSPLPEGATAGPCPPPPAAVPAAAASVPLKGGCLPPDPIPELLMPEKVNQEQIRRVAFLYLRKHEAERDALAKMLDQAAQTVPKKPLFLRRVLYQPVTEECEVKEILSRVAEAVVVLGLLDGLSEKKLRELDEALRDKGLMFRTVAPLDIGRKSMGVDIIVHMILLPHE